jgi:chromosome segregation ATPase
MTDDITTLIEQGKKLAEAVKDECDGWYEKDYFNQDLVGNTDAAYIVHHSPATMLRLYAEIERIGKERDDFADRWEGVSARCQQAEFDLQFSRNTAKSCQRTSDELRGQIEAKDAEIARLTAENAELTARIREIFGAGWMCDTSDMSEEDVSSAWLAWKRKNESRIANAVKVQQELYARASTAERRVFNLEDLVSVLKKTLEQRESEIAYLRRKA